MTRNDKLIRDQAILRNREIEARRKQERTPPQGLGNIITGSVFDCNRKHFERVLRDYSDRLYVGWNPYKKEGQGCWEIWHRPTYKTPVHRLDYQGVSYYSLEYLPNDFEHWVADLDYLDYTFISRLREMDSWENRQLVSSHDDQAEAFKDKLDRDETEQLKYVVRHNKSAFKDLLDYTQQGFNPLDFFTKNVK